jgi:hypothetical protein
MKALNDARRVREKKSGKPYDDGHRSPTQCFHCKKELDHQALVKNPYLAFCEGCLEMQDIIGMPVETTTD